MAKICFVYVVGDSSPLIVSMHADECVTKISRADNDEFLALPGIFVSPHDDGESFEMVEGPVRSVYVRPKFVGSVTAPTTVTQDSD